MSNNPQDQEISTMKQTVLVALSLLHFALFFCASVQAVTLVEAGRPAAVIVTSESPTRVARLAALELRWHIEQITGARLPIGTEPEDGKAAVVVGAHPLAKEAGLSGWKAQEYALHFTEDTIFLVGDDSPKKGEVNYDMEDPWAFSSWPALDERQGTLHAAYEFLEDHADVRWWNPTEFGIDLPQTETLTVSGQDRRDRPAFLYRETQASQMAETYDRHTQYWHWEDPEYEEYLALAYPETHARWPKVNSYWRSRMQLWLMRMRLGGTERFRANHSFYGWFQRFLEKDSEHFEAYRPDLFAKGYEDRKRPPNLCFSNPETAEQTVEDARRYFDEGGYNWRRPGIGQLGYFWGEDHFAVVPLDSGHCRGETCMAQAGPDSPFFSSGKWSNYIFGFVNQVAREVKKTHPDKFISTLAYAGYARYPDEVQLEDNIAVQVCLHARHVYDRAIKQNDREILREWVEKLSSGRVYLWLYYTFPLEMGKFHANPRWHVFPGFFGHHIGESFKRYENLGIRGAFFNGFAQGLDAYLTLRMLHDPSENVDEVIDEYFSRQYGAAGEPLKRFYLMVEDIYGDPDNYSPAAKARGLANTPGIIGHQTKQIAWGRLGTPERMEELKSLMEKARALAETDLQKRRVALFDLSVWQYMYRAVHQTRSVPNLERWPGHPATLLQDRRPAFDQRNALRGKPFVLETPGALAIADAEARAKPGVPFSQLTDGRGEPPVRTYVPAKNAGETPSTSFRCDLGPVPDKGRRLRALRVFWSIAEGPWQAAFRLEVRDADSGEWHPVTRDFVFDQGQRIPDGFRKLRVPFPAGAVTNFDAIRLIDNSERMKKEASWHWMHATRFMEIEAEIMTGNGDLEAGG